MKLFFIILGGIFAAILSIVLITIAVSLPREIRLEHSAEAYVQATLPKIAAHWKARELSERATPALISAITPHQSLRQIFMIYRQLGLLKHIGKPKVFVFVSFTSGASANVTVPAQFEKGHATVMMQLSRSKHAWKINAFYVKSEIFTQELAKP